MRHDERDNKEVMRNPVTGSPLEPYLPLPNHIEILSNSEAEAHFYAQAYKKARTSKDKEKVINGLLRNGGKWDIITRSLTYYPDFEKFVGKSFPGLWQSQW